jgi:hypothetical protein
MRLIFEIKAVIRVSLGEMIQIAAYFGISLGIVSTFMQEAIMKTKNIPKYFFIL